jgi:hypothetical protein
MTARGRAPADIVRPRRAEADTIVSQRFESPVAYE